MKLNSEKEKMIIDKLKAEGAEKIALFGSYVRNEQKEDSDIDILTSFVDTKSLLDLSRIQRELSELLMTRVDLLTEKGVSKLLIDEIQKTLRVIYEKSER